MNENTETMEDNPPRSRRKKMAHKTHPPRCLSFTSQSQPSSSPSSSSTQSSSSNHGRLTRSARTMEEEEELTRKCSVECTGQSCRACSAALVADCVALCCCPLAAISLLALAFIKVPYAMGKRCLGRRKRREKGKKRVGISRKDSVGFSSNGDSVVERAKDIVFEFGEDGIVEQRRKSLCTGFVELDNVLLELYQVGHLGFGRVSFTGNGIQPNAKSN